MVPYEESVRVPLVIAGPDISPGTTDSMATTIDLFPTILGWAGVPVASDVDGVSLAGPLAGGAGLRSDFIAEYGGPGASGRDGVLQEMVPPTVASDLTYAFDVPSYVAVRNDRYLYVRWYERERPLEQREYELYDLEADPYQLTNLLATPEGRDASAGIVDALDARLETLVGCSGAGCR